MAQTINLDQLPPELLQVIEAYKSGVAGTRSPIRQQLKDLREPSNPKGKLHRPSFSFSADADPDAPAYMDQRFPTLRFHPKLVSEKNPSGEMLVPNQDALDKLSDEWQEQPIVHAAVSAFDAARADLDSLSEDDRATLLEMQKAATMNRIQAALAGLTDAERATLLASRPIDAPLKRGPGRARKSDGDGA